VLQEERIREQVAPKAVSLTENDQLPRDLPLWRDAA
jgi:hypothetical protein